MTGEELADGSKASSRRLSRGGSWTTRGSAGSSPGSLGKLPWAQALGECPHRAAAQGECPAGRGRHSSARSTAGLPSSLPQPTRVQPQTASSGCPHLGVAHVLSSLCNQLRDPFLHTSWDSASWYLLLEEWWGDLLLNAQVNPQNSLCLREWDEVKTEELHCYCVPVYRDAVRKEHSSIPPALPLSSLL